MHIPQERVVGKIGEDRPVTADAPVLVLTAQRRELVRRAVVSLLFVAVGALLIAHPLSGGAPRVPAIAQRIVGVFVVGVFGLNAINQVRVLPGRTRRLELTEQGFRLIGARSERFILWSDCSPFAHGGRQGVALRNGRLALNVVFNETTPTDSRLGRFGPTDAATYGWTSLLPSSYGMTWPDLAALMNQCRANALSGLPILQPQQPTPSGTVTTPAAPSGPSPPPGPSPGRGRHR
jgi:hypothetical protein